MPHARPRPAGPSRTLAQLLSPWRLPGLALTAVAALATSLGGCTIKTRSDDSGQKTTSLRWGGSAAPSPIERYVDVPTELEALRKLADSPGTRVVVEPVTVRYDSSGKVANCGHAGLACALILLLPEGKGEEKFQRAHVEVDGQRTWEGTFSSEGEFRAARVVQGTQVRYLQLIAAGHIGRRLVVEVARATLGADGTEGERAPVSILAQVDLSGAWTPQLLKDQEHGEHKPGGLGAKLAARETKARFTLAEIKRVLGVVEARKVAEGLLEDARLTDSLKAAIRDEFKLGTPAGS